MLILWVISAILAFNVLFVALRLWATRPRQPGRQSVYGLAPAYATIIAKEYPHRAPRRTHPGRSVAHH